MDGSLLSLRAALATDRLEDFVRQEQARGVELGRGSEFERALALFLVQRRMRQDHCRRVHGDLRERDERGRRVPRISTTDY
jgi:hypothetical protein